VVRSLTDGCVECYGSAEESQLTKSCGGVMRPGTVMPSSLVRGTIIQRLSEYLLGTLHRGSARSKPFSNNTEMFIALFPPGAACHVMIWYDETCQHIKDVHHSVGQCDITKSLTSEGSIQITG